MITFEEAAAARCAGIRQRADRPSQRRSAEGGTSFRASFPASIALRAKGETSDALVFDGLASATERGYEMWDAWGPYTEIVSAGAFADSLARADLDVPLVLGHDQLRRIARTTNGTLSLEESDAGLVVRAELDPSDPDVAYITPKLRAGLIDEMSFAFRITAGQWSPDYSEFRINAAELHRGDTAIVGFGANPFTQSALRAAPDTPRQRAAVQREAGMALVSLRTLTAR